MIRNLTRPFLINGRWYDSVRIWGRTSGDGFAATPPHYQSDKRFWIVFADQIAVDDQR